MRQVLLCVLVAALSVSAPAHALWTGPSGDQAIAVAARAVTIDVLTNDVGVLKPKSLHIQRAPTSGSVEVTGRSLTYTPAAGFAGRDSFDYRVVGTRGSGVATVVVDVSNTLVLQGQIVDGPGVANVVAEVMGEAYRTQSDANGAFTVEIPLRDNDMVTLEASGIGDQEHIRFGSIVGSSDRLLMEAGSDRILMRDENNQVQITSLSTAQANLLLKANGDKGIDDDVSLANARDSLDYSQLLPQAAAIKLVADGDYPLPSGAGDTQALVDNVDAFAQFVAEVDADDPAALPNAIAAIVSDRNVILPASTSDWTGSRALIANHGPPGALNVQFVQGTRLSLDSGGNGRYATATPNQDPSVMWLYDASRVDVTPNSPVATQTYRFLPDGRTIRMLITPTRYELSKLFDGRGRDTVSLTSTQAYTFPDNPEIPPETRVNSSALLAIDDRRIDPLLPADVVGTRALWIPEPHTTLPEGSFGGVELYTFFSDGTGQRWNTVPYAFRWSIDVLGRLAFIVNGDSALFRQLKVDGRKGQVLSGEWAGGNWLSARSTMSAIADGFVFDASNAQRSWRSGFYIGTSSVQPAGDLVFVLDPSRVAWQRTASAAGTVSAVPVGWRIANGAVEILSYRNGSNQPVHECQPGVSGCRITMVRRWRPLSAADDRTYVIEELFQDNNGDGVLDLFNQRVNYYDEVTRPSLSAGTAPSLRGRTPPAVSRRSAATSLSPATPPAPPAAPVRD